MIRVHFTHPILFTQQGVCQEAMFIDVHRIEADPEVLPRSNIRIPIVKLITKGDKYPVKVNAIEIERIDQL